jgi:hypothetical protein
VHIFIYE